MSGVKKLIKIFRFRRSRVSIRDGRVYFLNYLEIGRARGFAGRVEFQPMDNTGTYDSKLLREIADALDAEAKKGGRK